MNGPLPMGKPPTEPALPRGDEPAVDAIVHNAVMSVTNMYGVLLAQKDRQLQQLQFRLQLAQQEIHMLRNAAAVTAAKKEPEKTDA